MWTDLKHKPTNVRRIALKRQEGGNTLDPAGIRTIDFLLHNQMHCTPGYPALLIPMLQPIFLFATSFTSEWEQKRSLKNEERKREKVTWEIKECSGRKTQNGQAKNLHKKDQHVYNNCYELRSRAISKNINQLMSEELLSNDRRVEKHLTPQGFEPLTYRFITICTTDCALALIFAVLQQTLY